MSKKRLKGGAFVVLAIVAILVLASCGNSDEPEKTVEYYMDEYNGTLEVYEEILSTTNCNTLQEKYAIAVENNERQTPGTSLYKVTLGYMVATDDQMQKIGCYE